MVPICWIDAVDAAGLYDRQLSLLTENPLLSFTFISFFLLLLFYSFDVCFGTNIVLEVRG